jgi:hypothetical protein
VGIVLLEVRARDKKALPVLNAERSNLRPLRRSRYALNQQKVNFWRSNNRKKKKYYVRSRNVYENNEKADIMPDEMSDIHVDTTRFARKIAVSERQCVLIDASEASSLHNLRRLGASRPPTGRSLIGLFFGQQPASLPTGMVSPRCQQYDIYQTRVSRYNTGPASKRP